MQTTPTESGQVGVNANRPDGIGVDLSPGLTCSSALVSTSEVRGLKFEVRREP